MQYSAILQVEFQRKPTEKISVELLNFSSCIFNQNENKLGAELLEES